MSNRLVPWGDGESCESRGESQCALIKSDSVCVITRPNSEEILLTMEPIRIAPSSSFIVITNHITHSQRPKLNYYESNYLLLT